MFELIHANCIDALRQMPDRSVDCIVTDPPYVIGTKGSGITKDRQYLDDIAHADFANGFDLSILDECLRIVRVPNLIFFASRLQLRDYLNWAHERDLYWSLICWHKTNPIPLTAPPYLPDTEYALHFSSRKATRRLLPQQASFLCAALWQKPIQPPDG